MPFPQIDPILPLKYTSQVDYSKFANLLNPPTPTPTQIPALVPYPVPTQYPTYTYTPTAVQMRPLAEVQRAAIDPTLLLLGGVAVLALVVMALKR